MAEDAHGDGSANLKLPFGGFRLALAAASFLFMEAGNLRSGGQQFLRDRLFDVGFLLGLVWFGIALTQIISRTARRRKGRPALRNDF